MQNSQRIQYFTTNQKMITKRKTSFFFFSFRVFLSLYFMDHVDSISEVHKIDAPPQHSKQYLHDSFCKDLFEGKPFLRKH